MQENSYLCLSLPLDARLEVPSKAEFSLFVRSHSCQAAFFDMPKARGPVVDADWSTRKHESFVFRVSQKGCMGREAMTRLGVRPTLSVTR